MSALPSHGMLTLHVDVQRIYRLALDDVQSLKASGSGPELEAAARASRCAAFATALALAVKTQANLKFYALPLKGSDGTAAGAT